MLNQELISVPEHTSLRYETSAFEKLSHTCVDSRAVKACSNLESST